MVSPFWSDLLGDAPGERDAHDLVAEVGGRAEHQRAAAVDHGDPVSAAVVRGGGGHARAAAAPVHPDVLDPEPGALAHRLRGELGPRRDHHRVDAAGDRGQVRVRVVTLDLVGVRVHREHLVPSVAQPLVDGVAPVRLRRPGHTGDGDAPVRQERRCGLLDVFHRFSLLFAAARPRMAPATRSAPPARKSAPAARRPAAIHPTAGMRAPRSARTSTPGRPSAFITTTVHDPFAGFQCTVRAPRPLSDATQKRCAPGAEPTVPPSTLFVLSSKNSEITVRFTPARYRSTSLARATPTNSGAVPAGVTRIRTLPSMPGE